MSLLKGLLRRGEQTQPAFIRPRAPDIAENGEALVAASTTSRFYRVSTAQGTWLAAGASSTEAHRTLVMQEEDGPEPHVYAVAPDANRQRCFLVAADGGAFSIRVDGLCSVAVSARRLATDAPGLVRLKHPLSPLHYLGIADADRNHPGELVFDTLGQTMQCVFGMLPVAETSVPDCVRAIASELARASAPPPRAAVLLAQLASKAVRPELAETLLRLLPPDELQLLALRLLEDAPALAALQAALPGNRWLHEIFPALARWRHERNPVPGGTLFSSIADQFAAEPFEGISLPQAGMALVALARRQTGPRRGACVLATVRNEGPYLLDWIAYHLSIGFEHIFLYTNDNDDGSPALLEALAAHGVVTLIHNQSGKLVGPQYKAYAHALLLLPQILDYRWTAVIDADEYIGYDTTMFADFGEFVAWQETQPVDAIALCWLIHGADLVQGYTTDPTPERFPMRDPQVNWHVKSLFRTKDFWQSQAHFPTRDARLAVRLSQRDRRAAPPSRRGKTHSRPCRDRRRTPRLGEPLRVAQCPGSVVENGTRPRRLECGRRGRTRNPACALAGTHLHGTGRTRQGHRGPADNPVRRTKAGAPRAAAETPRRRGARRKPETRIFALARYGRRAVFGDARERLGSARDDRFSRNPEAGARESEKRGFFFS